MLLVGLLALTIGFAALAVVMHRPVPHRITSWGPVPGLPDWVGQLLPDSLGLTRLTLGLTFGVLIASHLVLLRQLRPTRPTRWTLPIIGAGGPLLAVVAATAPYSFSGDVYAYIVYGRVAAIHGANPMTTPPEAFPDDAFLGLMAPEYLDTPSVYGPTWNAASHGLTLFAERLGGAPDTYVLVYGAICGLGFLTSVWALWALLGLWRPAAQVAGTVLYAWSPLAVVELSAIHNDFVMLAMVGVGLVLAAKDRHAAAIALLSAAVLVKWIAIVVLVAVSLQAVGRARSWRGSLLRASADVGVFLVVAFVLVVGFGDVVGSLTSPFNAEVGGVLNSLGELGAVAVTQIAPTIGVAASTADAVAFMEALSKAAAALVLALVAVRSYREPSLRAAVATSATGLVAITLVAPKLWPWYALWALMLAPLAGRRTRAVAVALSATVLLVYVLSPADSGRTLLTAGLPVWIVGGALAALLWRGPMAPASGSWARSQHENE